MSARSRPVLFTALLFQLVVAPLARWRCSAQQPTPPLSPDDLTKVNLEDLMNIEVETVYSASKFEQKVTNAPSYVTIVTADEIAKHGYRTLADVLRSVPGFYVSYDRNYCYVGVRGFTRPGDYNNRILLMVDGHRLNENVYQGVYVGTEFPLDIALIARVEIIRGPGSALYGTDAFFAVVNVITKRGRDFHSAEIAASAGSLQSFDARASYGDQWKNTLETLFSGTFYHSLGNHRLYYPEFDSPLTNNGYAVGADGDAARTFFANVQYKDFALQGVYGWRQKTIPTASFGTVFNDSR
jgi:outer membrane receptor for ferrienterochelin and colicins